MSGLDPVISAAADLCVAAVHDHNLSGVRQACQAIHTRVRELTSATTRGTAA